jgi:hypothetical protein
LGLDLAEANDVKTYYKLTTNLAIHIVKIKRLKQGKSDTKAIQKVIQLGYFLNSDVVISKIELRK